MFRKRPLFITLYPLIPDAGKDKHQKYRERLTREFEFLHPEIKLTLRIGMEYNTGDPKYMDEAIPNELADGFEIDAMNLSYVVSKGWALPVTQTYTENQDTLYPQALQAFTIDGTLYAHPSALCTCFIFSRHKEILDAQSMNDLLQILQKKGESLPKLLGNFFGPTLISIYYSLFYIGMYGPENAKQSMQLPIDPQVVGSMKEMIADSIEYSLKNTTLQLSDYTNPDFYWAIKDYIVGKSHSCIGFSEDLHHILQGGSSEPVYYIPALFGDKQYPLFANGFVTNAVNCTENRKKDVEAFAQYYRSPKVMRWRALAEDASNVPPRYLLPVSQNVFSEPDIELDPHFQNFTQVLRDGVVFPNTGYLENRFEMAKAIYEQL